MSYSTKSCRVTPSEKSPYSEILWSVSSPIWTEYRPEKLRIRRLFTQCYGLIGFQLLWQIKYDYTHKMIIYIYIYIYIYI